MSSDLYLTDEQEQHIIEAIAAAENWTSGEIRVHIESTCDAEPLVRAARVFHELGMDETELQNGVLIYIAADDHKVAVYAGKGIHKEVEDGFWDGVLNLLLDHFRKDEFEQGIANAVTRVGSKLKDLYPYQRGDVNELSDEISYHDNSDD
ncbi:TPM domain-containing protein [Aliifodinibius sp. S!AR15-10]|uniref:TPM domain-containing protein n=1 Tax=Aliifodinibius sp. S!AR15-10 TaxID=2950437 RepID=UPI002854801B|nr:TPM domain-containing protein [Aliifodinibius sp. S!AR15-10]MDR8393552.1 TPM domain-containing protein [Aliifodinibius sp. S!AR15-10]